jgi:hypothetical protein
MRPSNKKQVNEQRSKPTNKQRLDKTIATLQVKHGPRIIEAGSDLPQLVIPPSLSTGFAPLDQLTGCKGIPLGHITLLTGKTTSGKLTLAYKVLAQAQSPAKHKDPVAVLDLTRASDPAYLALCGVDLAHTLFVRPPQPNQSIRLIYTLLKGYGLRALLVDGLADLLRSPDIARDFDVALPHLAQVLRAARCALICLDEPCPPWLAWLRLASSAISHAAALHIDLRREQWIEQHDGALLGYSAQAQIVRSKWARSLKACTLNIQVSQASSATTP